jgi:basic amino acid/polyamine antiporter, APA family
MPQLKRDLGRWAAVSIVIGSIIGSGIFLVPKTMIMHVGSPAMVFAVWIFGGLLSLAGALTYAELAAAYPQAGGEYVYLREAYGPMFGFLYGWTRLWVAQSGSIATLAAGFYLYLAYFFPGLESVFTSIGALNISYGQLVAVGAIFALTLLNYMGTRLGGDVQVATTALKVGLIAVVILAGLLSGQGSSANLATSVPAQTGIAAFFAALVAALWAYDGWNNVTMVASEIKQPEKNLPIALILGTLGVVAIYLLINLAYFYVLPADVVASSNRVASTMMERIAGPIGASAVAVAALITIFSALNASILSGARVSYAMAADGFFFKWIAGVHPRHFTPGPALLLQAVWSSVLVLSGTFDQLFNYVIFASWLLYGLTGASVIVLRYKRPDLARPYRAIGYPWIPGIFVLVSAAFVISTLISSPGESIRGLVLIFLGLPPYFYWKSRRSHIRS